jgi:insertion element IS1 protein InsB
MSPEQHVVGKKHTQKIESKSITLRTRITRRVRRTMCCAQTARMHDLVIGLCINRYALRLFI